MDNKFTEDLNIKKDWEKSVNTTTPLPHMGYKGTTVSETLTEEQKEDLEKQLKKSLYTCGSISAEQYRDMLFELNPCSFYTPDLLYIFDELNKSINNGNIVCRIPITRANRFNSDWGKDSLYFSKTSEYFLEKLGYTIYHDYPSDWDLKNKNKNGELIINPFSKYK